MYIPIILGTARKGRQSEKVAKFMLDNTLKYGLKSEIIDVRDYRIEATDATGESEKAKNLAEKITKADALIIVSPEYNHSFPGELKMMLDMLYKQYSRKPIAFCGVSAGNLGGARAVEQLINLAVALNMVPIKQTLYFPSIKTLFNEKGEILLAAYQARVQKFLDELVWYARKLSQADEQ